MTTYVYYIPLHFHYNENPVCNDIENKTKTKGVFYESLILLPGFTSKQLICFNCRQRPGITRAKRCE